MAARIIAMATAIAIVIAILQNPKAIVGTPSPNIPFPTNFVLFCFYNIFIEFGILGWIRSGHVIQNPFVNCNCNLFICSLSDFV